MTDPGMTNSFNANPSPPPPLTGADLRQVIQQKWGQPFDLRFRRVQGRIFLQVMWKYLGQRSFPMTPAQYEQHLESIATYLQALGGTQQFLAFVAETRERPRLGKAVNIPLEVELGDRASEWLLE
ncbi:MAG: DUF3067 family protein [Prochlorothrix sp.]|nr:DUF3067 family protein [Prochlorothrix sp.]